MPSAGELLRHEREQRNRTLKEIASETCISTRYLQAIEADDVKILPGDFFHRSFIRQYANCLGLDASTTKRILDAVAPPADIDPLPALTVSQHIAHVEQQSKPLAHFSTRTAATLLFVVLAGCSGLSALWNRAQEAADPALRAVQAVEPSTLSVDVAATEKTWVSVSSEGRTVYAGTLDPSQTKNFALVENAKLLTRNAAALDVRVNGRPLGPLGPRGQARLVLLSTDRFQIFAPNQL